MRKGLLGAQLPLWGWGCMATGPLDPQSREGPRGGPGHHCPETSKAPVGSPVSRSPVFVTCEKQLVENLTCAEEQPGAFLRVFSPREHGRQHSVGEGVSLARLAPAAARPPCSWLSRPLVGRQ